MFDEIEHVCICETPYFGTRCELKGKNGSIIQPDTPGCPRAEGFKGRECENGMSTVYIKNTVEPLYKRHLWEKQKVSCIHRCPLNRGSDVWTNY